MTPETKAWFVKIKEQYFNKSDKNPTSIFDIPPFVGLEEEALFTVIQIIESQEKEIEKLNFIITTVLDPSRKLSKIEGLEAK